MLISSSKQQVKPLKRFFALLRITATTVLRSTRGFR